MRKAKQKIAKVASRVLGMERTKLLVVCGAVIASAVVVITATLLLLNTQSAPNTTDIVISGEIACLPHKTTSGPQTLECALGLRTDDNRYFALKNIPAEQGNNVGARINIRGTLDTTTNSTYETAGTIEVISLSQ